MDLLVAIDDIVEFDTVLRCAADRLTAQNWKHLAARMNLADSVDGAHDQLV